MQYDFDTILDRRGRDALALDMIPYDGVEPKEGFSRIPMWVADMSFPTAPPVLEAIRARLDHPNFGYFQLSDAYFDSIIRWQQVRHGVTGLERQHIGYENGVLGGVSSVVQALTCPGEPILVHSPTYCRLHPHPGAAGPSHYPHAPDAGRGGHLAHGLCGYGPEAEGKRHPRGHPVLPSQSLRPGMGALGAGKGHGGVCRQRLHRHFR